MFYKVQALHLGMTFSAGPGDSVVERLGPAAPARDQSEVDG